MKKSLLLAILALFIFSLKTYAQGCDDFDRANSSTINGWTEQSGDWAINNNQLLSSASAGATYCTFDGSTLTDGCVNGRITYSGSADVKYGGLVARYTGPNNTLLAKVQDNTGSGFFDSYWIYSEGSIISSGTGLNFGTDVNMQLTFSGLSITLSIDTDRNGTWDFVYNASSVVVTSGLCGTGGYRDCYFDDYCCGTSCMSISPCDFFETTPGTNVPYWTESAGDWTISAGSLESPAVPAYNYIMYNGSEQADGCLTARVTYLGTPATRYGGLVARYSSHTSKIMAKIQDNSSCGYFDSYFIYNNDGFSHYGTSLNFGTDADIQMEYVGTTVIFRVDTDRNGIWDFSDTAVVTTTGYGSSGLTGYMDCRFDDFCYGDQCLNEDSCEAFNFPSSTNVPGWTERVGDWAISNDQLVVPPSAQWNYITRDSDQMTDACITARMIYTGSPSVRFAGLIGRYNGPIDYVMVKIQDNGPSGNWNTIYLNNNSTNIISFSGNYGNDADLQMMFIGDSLVAKVDTNRDGNWDYIYGTNVITMGAGFCGASGYYSALIDDWCLDTTCCFLPAAADSIMGFDLVCQGQSGVTYSIPAIYNATSYTWTYSGTGATLTPSGNNLSVNFSAGATPGFLSVNGVNSCGDGLPFVLPVFVDPCTGIRESANSWNMQVIPNPGDGMFFLMTEAPEAEDAELTVTSLTGNILYQETLMLQSGANKTPVDLSSLPNGMYLLCLKSSSGNMVRSLLIAR